MLGIVGESGSGKSVCCYSLMGLVPQPPGKIESGSAIFENQDLLSMSTKELRAIRGRDIAMIFQDPMTSLNPFLSIGEQLIEPLLYHEGMARETAWKNAIATLEEVGIKNAAVRINAFAHEFSGGMRQRVMIAMALINKPKLIIADEPTTALDVTIQAQILTLIQKLQKKRNIAVIFISHDLAVVKNVADRVLVMKSGEIVEQGKASELFNKPEHSYTQALIAAIPTGNKKNFNKPMQSSLLSVRQLNTSFYNAESQQQVLAVRDANFDLQSGEILGLVGESGSGKSTLGRSILRLLRSESESICFNGQDISTLSNKKMQPYRAQIQMIFQDPYASLNPRMTVFEILAEPLLFHKIATRSSLESQVLALMDEVGLERHFVRKYPHEFSGGQRQRIAIGRAIACKPKLIIADEPVSALDVTIQKQILELLLALVEKHDLSMLFISHDLSVVRYLCDRVLVMRHGEILETGDTEDIWNKPQHSYTVQLIAAAQ